MKRFNDCKQIGIPKKSEQGKTFIIKSGQDFICEIVDVDNCLFKNEPFKKCDWLFLIAKNKHLNKDLKIEKSLAYYVELKGIALDDACEQLFNSIDKTKSEIPNFNIEARVISTKGFQPEIINLSFYKKVKKMIRKDIMICKVHKGNNYTHIETI